MVLGNIAELEEPAARVVEDAVEDDSNTACVSGFNERVERLVTPEHRVDLEIVMSVIAVIRGTLEDRVKPNRVYAQIDEVVEFFNNAPEVAALITVMRRRNVPRLDPGPDIDLPRAMKPIWEDLIEDGIFDP